jgi:hypothetical protein
MEVIDEVVKMNEGIANYSSETEMEQYRPTTSWLVNLN